MKRAPQILTIFESQKMDYLMSDYSTISLKIYLTTIYGFPVDGTLVEHHHLHFLKTVYYFKLILFNLFKLTLLFILLIKSCLFFTFEKTIKIG